MMSKEYNGWTNYATWKINLEVLDGMTPEDFGYDRHELDTDDVAGVEKLAMTLEMYVCDLVESTTKGYGLDLAHSFLADVNWDEIASHMIYDYATA